jgi:hypothetical protein
MPETPDSFSADFYIAPEIWPFRPVKDMSETIGFSTDVIRTYTSEMRISRRPARQSLAFSYALRDPRLAKMEARLRRNPLGDWLVPVWHEATLIPSTVPGQTIVEVDTAADYRVGGFVVFWSACDRVQVRRVAAIASGTITISHPLDLVSGAAFAAPGRVGFLMDGIGGSRIRERSGISTVDVEFMIRDAVDLSATDFVQYLGRDVVTKCGTLEPLSFAVSPDIALVDSDLGRIDRELSRDPIDGRFALMWRLSREKLWTVRQWLHYVRGRDRPFWLADWQKDFRLAAPIDAADTTILIEPVTRTPEEMIGAHIAIDDGEISPREVTAATVSGGNHLLAVAPLGRDIASAKVRRMRFVRLDSDLIEIGHRMGFYSEIRLPLVEVTE